MIHQEVLIIIQVEKSPDRPSNGGHRLNLKGLIRNCLLTFKDRLDSLNHILRCGRHLLLDRTSRADLCSLCFDASVLSLTHLSEKIIRSEERRLGKECVRTSRS